MKLDSLEFTLYPKYNEKLTKKEPVKVILKNIKTNRFSYFNGMPQTCEFLGVSDTCVREAYKHDWFIKDTYKVVGIRNVPKYNSKTGKRN